MEDLAYRRLLDEYYLHESPLLSGVATVARQIGMREQEKEVAFVLECFFTLTDKGWIHTRADKEIEHFHSKIEQASRAGKASAERRLNGRSTDRPTDVQPTNNHKPITNNQNTKAPVVAAPDGVSQSTWESFVRQRKTKKAQITPLVLDGIKREAEIAGWPLEQALREVVIRNWQSFKAEWVTKPQLANKADVAHATAPPPPNQDAALKKIEEDRKKAVPIPDNIREKIAALKKVKA
jgi:uncharacterized protein YdaU (DUF1376 family)